ncbi:hypothetical protein BPOR_0047g00160 [Botrytis porri]|uniref:Uncharacterized protein n=1 Tax=Botrytis porri TaxID=87229 RepID=A0A4Z1L2U2_9HELO|nr:hypothetical protein BPOR_0047g00160 [Botrytis porri]
MSANQNHAINYLTNATHIPPQILPPMSQNYYIHFQNPNLYPYQIPEHTNLLYPTYPSSSYNTPPHESRALTPRQTNRINNALSINPLKTSTKPQASCENAELYHANNIGGSQEMSGVQASRFLSQNTGNHQSSRNFQNSNHHNSQPFQNQNHYIPRHFQSPNFDNQNGNQAGNHHTSQYFQNLNHHTSQPFPNPNEITSNRETVNHHGAQPFSNHNNQGINQVTSNQKQDIGSHQDAQPFSNRNVENEQLSQPFSNNSDQSVDQTNGNQSQETNNQQSVQSFPKDNAANQSQNATNQNQDAADQEADAKEILQRLASRTGDDDMASQVLSLYKYMMNRQTLENRARRAMELEISSLKAQYKEDTKTFIEDKAQILLFLDNYPDRLKQLSQIIEERVEISKIDHEEREKFRDEMDAMRTKFESLIAEVKAVFQSLNFMAPLS